MNFGDTIKQAFQSAYESDISLSHILMVMGITCLLAVFIYFIYRIVNRNTFYSKTMNIALAGISVITAAIIITIQSSLIVSLGMVGALSIVRFRTAVKNPMDLMFLFWSIGVGIICGAGLAEIAVILSVIMAIGIFLLDKHKVAKAPMVLVVNATDDAHIEDKILEIVQQYTKSYKVKSRSFSNDHLDLIIELRVKEEQQCIRAVKRLDSVLSASLLSHDGEVSY
jgi:uncharacterized membrane protein YhiD involved in acid resistance